MVCPDSGWVELFVAGRLGNDSVSRLESHVELCQECFLRVAVAAGETEPSEPSLLASIGATSRLRRCLESSSLARTTVPAERLDDTAAGQRKYIGPYLVTGLMGVGGMSVVYRARHQVSGREVAIKTVKMPLMASFLAMLRQEIQFLKEAHHPGIVEVLDSDLMANDPWYAMELFDGPSLQSFNTQLWEEPAPRPGEPASGQPVAAGGRLADVLRLYARLCDPIAFIHHAGLVHGDLKPSNIFLRGQQEPVVMDFGLASRARGMVGRDALDVTGRIRGTLPYIAPETIRGQLPDARADLYALGCMMYESIVGEPPFVARSGTRIIDMHLSVAPARPSGRVTGVPEGLEDLLLSLLAKNPRDRFGHARALASALLEIADSLASGAANRESAAFASEPSMPLFRPPIVGREPELARILDFVEQAARGSAQGGMFLLSGESGIGKTFLAAELGQRAVLAGIQVVTGDCVPLTLGSQAAADAGTVPLQPFRRFFQMLRDRCQERGSSEIDRLFGSRLEILSAYLPTLRPLRGPDAAAEPPARLPALAARERIVTAVLDTLIAYASGRSLVLAIDDLQWADDLSLAVLHRLDEDIFSKTPLIIIGTYRSDEAGEGVKRLAEKPTATDLRLSRLGAGDTGAMIGGMLSMSAAPQALVDYIHAHAEGIPFFAAEYLRSFVAAGALLYRKGGWSVQERDSWHAGVSLPSTLQELLRSRLDRLPTGTVEAVQAGGLVGRRFSASLVARMLDTSAGEIVSAMKDAVIAQIAQSDGFDGFTFLHDKIRETLYSGLSPERKQQLHLAAARAMEADTPIPPERHAEIGQHFRHGGDALKALDHLERAGEHALAIAANTDAERFFRQALELEADLSPRQPAIRRARWLRQQGDALQGLGLMAESVAPLKASAALLGRPFPTGAGAFARMFTREVLSQTWHRLRPIARRQGRLKEAAANEEIVRVFDRMHQASFYLGRDADLVFSTSVSLNSSERAAPAPSLVVAYTNAAMMSGVIPLPRLAERYFRLALETSRKVRDPAAESWLLLMEGAYRTWLGQRARSIECLDQALALLTEMGSFRHADEAASARIGIDVFAGFHRPAMARLRKVEAQARKRRDLQIQCWVGLQTMETHIIRGDVSAAWSQLEQVRPLVATQGRPEQIWATGFETYLTSLRQDLEAAEELATRAIQLIRQGPPVHSYCASAYDRVAEVVVGLCAIESDKAQRKSRIIRARNACGILDRAKRVFPIVRPAAALHGGRLSLILGRQSVPAVVAGWRAACAVARELVLPFQELRLCRAIISQLPPDAPEATPERARERELLETMELADRPADPPAPVPVPPPSTRGVKVESEGHFV